MSIINLNLGQKNALSLIIRFSSSECRIERAVARNEGIRGVGQSTGQNLRFLLLLFSVNPISIYFAIWLYYTFSNLSS